MTGCSICNLKNANMRPQVELIEKLLRNESHTRYITKPLSYTQICYIAYIIMGIKMERQVLQRHYTICMWFTTGKCPIHYNPHIRAWVNTKGEIVSKEERRKYKTGSNSRFAIDTTQSETEWSRDREPRFMNLSLFQLFQLSSQVYICSTLGDFSKLNRDRDRLRTWVWWRELKHILKGR